MHIKTLAYAVWHSQQRLLSEGESEFWEIYKLTKSQLLTLLFWERFSVLLVGNRNRTKLNNKTQPNKKKEKESKKHLSLKIFWLIARASLFSYLSYCVRQSKEYVRRYLIVIWSHMKVCPKIWSHKRLAQAAGQKCKNVISLAIDRYMV